MTVTEDVRTNGDLRSQALARLAKKREFLAHFMAYLMVHAILIAVWAMTGARFFWPIFPLMGWGIGIGFHAWDTYSRPPTEDRIRKEIDRLRRV